MCFYVGLESGRQVEILSMFSIAVDPRLVSMLRIYEYVLSFWVWECSTCRVSMNVFFYFCIESGQHVEILPMFSIALDSRVVNMLKCELIRSFIFWIWEWSTCWDSIYVLLYLGSESGQHVEILHTVSIALDSSMVDMLSLQWIRFVILDLRLVNMLGFNGHVLLFLTRLVNMLRLYPCFLLPWIRGYSTCWDANEYVFYVGFENGRRAEVLLICYSIWDSIVVNMLRYTLVFYRIGFESGQGVAILMKTFNHLAFKHGQHVEIYPCFLSHWIRVWSMCCDSNENVQSSCI